MNHHQYKLKQRRRRQRWRKLPRCQLKRRHMSTFLKSKQEQLGYLIASTLRIEKGLATLTRNQESLERIMEQKFYDLDVKVTEIQSAMEQLQDDMQERKGKTTTDAFARVPRAQRSSAVPNPDT